MRRDDCITFLGAGIRPSLSTPSMIGWMEFCCRDAILPHLSEGQDSVGVEVSAKHLAPTPMGRRVACTATVAAVDGRRVRFDVTASEGAEVVGTATHVRFVIDVERFARKLRKRFG